MSGYSRDGVYVSQNGDIMCERDMKKMKTNSSGRKECPDCGREW